MGWVVLMDTRLHLKPLSLILRTMKPRAVTINSNYGIVIFGFLYIGWNNHPHQPVNCEDFGDETFGLALGCLYIGHYSCSGWCGGILNRDGYLDIGE